MTDSVTLRKTAAMTLGKSVFIQVRDFDEAIPVALQCVWSGSVMNF